MPPLGGARNKGGCHCSATPEVGWQSKGRRGRGTSLKGYGGEGRFTNVDGDVFMTIVKNNF